MAMTPRNVVVPVPAGQPTEIFATTTTPALRWIRNRGPSDATIVTGGAASGAATETTLLVGERRRVPYRTQLNLAAFSAGGTTIEGEEWK